MSKLTIENIVFSRFIRINRQSRCRPFTVATNVRTPFAVYVDFGFPIESRKNLNAFVFNAVDFDTQSFDRLTGTDDLRYDIVSVVSYILFNRDICRKLFSRSCRATAVGIVEKVRGKTIEIGTKRKPV